MSVLCRLLLLLVPVRPNILTMGIRERTREGGWGNGVELFSPLAPVFLDRLLATVGQDRSISTYFASFDYVYSNSPWSQRPRDAATVSLDRRRIVLGRTQAVELLLRLALADFDKLSWAVEVLPTKRSLALCFYVGQDHGQCRAFLDLAVGKQQETHDRSLAIGATPSEGLWMHVSGPEGLAWSRCFAPQYLCVVAGACVKPSSTVLGSGVVIKRRLGRETTVRLIGIGRRYLQQDIDGPWFEAIARLKAADHLMGLEVTSARKGRGDMVVHFHPDLGTTGACRLLDRPFHYLTLTQWHDPSTLGWELGAKMAEILLEPRPALVGSRREAILPLEWVVVAEAGGRLTMRSGASGTLRTLFHDHLGKGIRQVAAFYTRAVPRLHSRIEFTVVDSCWKWVGFIVSNRRYQVLLWSMARVRLATGRNGCCHVEWTVDETALVSTDAPNAALTLDLFKALVSLYKSPVVFAVHLHYRPETGSYAGREVQASVVLRADGGLLRARGRGRR